MYKFAYIVISVFIFIFVFVGCSAAENSTTTATNSSGTTSSATAVSNRAAENIAPFVEKDNVIYVSKSIDQLNVIKDLKPLLKSDSIFTGTCISSDPLFQNNILYTIVKIKVSEVFRGKMNAGDTVALVEMGGRTTVGEYNKGCSVDIKTLYSLPDAPSDKKMVVGSDGYFPAKKDDKVLLFVKDCSGFFKNIEGALYTVTGTYDGKFILQNDGSYAHPKPTQTDQYEFGGMLMVTKDQLNEISKQ